MKLTPINTNFFKLDGGAMFGVVPNTMWRKLNPPDEHNMCTWAMRCLLVETNDGRKVLIDTGLGDKQDDKFRSHFQPHGGEGIVAGLGEQGVSTDDITDVVLTHLHFDHVGGAVIRDNNALVPTFAKAKYWTTKAHYDWAFSPNPREKASFLKENFEPLLQQNVLNFVDETQGIELFKGFHLDFAYGHTEAMMTPRLQIGDRTLLYCADLLASYAHIGLPYVMAYDVRPLETMREKEIMLRQAAEQNWILFFEHDPVNECCTVKFNERGQVVLKDKMTLADAMNKI
jgi:glyoxylase-like metal-dependent hydrolase (beta-lactamase superfamily II)